MKPNLLLPVLLVAGLPLLAEISVRNGDRLAFMGASITQFGNADRFGYVNLVVDGLKRQGIEVSKIPAGVSGDRSHMMLARFDRDVVAQNPQWVVIKAGPNDITWRGQGKGNDLAAFVTNLTAMCDKADKAGIRVLLVKPTLIGERNWAADARNVELAKFCDEIGKLAAARGYRVADAYDAELKALEELKPLWLPRFTTDNLHLNGRGNILLACEILRAFGVSDEALASCRETWENQPSMRGTAERMRDIAKRLPAKEVATLERLAAEKGMTLDDYVMDFVHEEAAYRGGKASFAPSLTAKIAGKWPVVKTDDWHGGRRTVFRFKGREAWVVEPCPGAVVAAGTPWTWTMQWATAFVPRTGVPQLLRRGWHHVTIDQFKERMTEEGLKLSKEFQEYLVKDLGFAPKANLVGMSWGGFLSTRYALAYPELVRKVYLDAPVLTFDGFKHDCGPWKKRMPADGWAASPEMPVNRAAGLAASGIPILLFYGGADDVVNPQKNCLRFIDGYKAAGGKDMVVCPRPAFGHHPHGVEPDNPTIRDFFADTGYFDPNKGKTE